MTFNMGWDRPEHRLLHDAEAAALRAITAIKEESHAIGYYDGEKVGVMKALQTISRTDAARGLTPEFKAELSTMLDRIQHFRQMIATYDTRYSILGEIIADFAKLLGPADAVEGET